MPSGNHWRTCAGDILTGDGGVDLNGRSSWDSWMVDTDLELLLLGVDSSSPFASLEVDADTQPHLSPPTPAIEHQEGVVSQHQLNTGWSDGDGNQLTECDDGTRLVSRVLSNQLLGSFGVGTEAAPEAARQAGVAPVVDQSMRAAVKRKPRAGGKAKYASTRDRRKSEMRVLREEATELETRVKQTKESTRSRVWQDSSAIVNLPPSSVSEMVLPLQPTWRHVAEQQGDLLRESAEVNASLRASVVAQTKLARSLQRMFKRRLVQIATVRDTIKSDPEWSHLGGSSDDRAVFARLLASADAMYAEVDRVVQTLDRKVPPAHDTFRSWEVKQASGGDGGDCRRLLSLEMASTEQLPFLRSDVHRAVRFSLGGQNPQMRNYGIENFDISSNTLLGKTHASSTSDLRSGTYRLRFASKYVVEETRSIFMTTTYIDSVSVSGEPIDELVLKEQKWTILTSQAVERGHPLDDKADTTQIQTLSVITPKFVPPSLADLWCKEVVETAVIPAWDSAVSAGQQLLENVLLAQTAA